MTARKSVQLWALPRVLVLHLKRFSYGLTGTGKIHKTIHYGERLRCAAPFQLLYTSISLSCTCQCC